MKKKSFETHKFVMAINPINLTLVIDEILEEGEPRFKKKIFYQSFVNVREQSYD